MQKPYVSNKVTGRKNNIKPSQNIYFMIHTRKLKQILDAAPFVEEKKERQWIPPDLKEGMKIRDKHRCVVCERKKNLKIHHIDPYGTSSPDNLVTLCEICHEYVHKILKRKGYPYISPLLAMKIRQRPFGGF